MQFNFFLSEQTVGMMQHTILMKVKFPILFQLMDGRKSVGGKLEVKVRIRDPFFTKQVEEVKERWLVIDHFDRKLPEQKVSELIKMCNQSVKSYGIEEVIWYFSLFAGAS